METEPINKQMPVRFEPLNHPLITEEYLNSVPLFFVDRNDQKSRFLGPGSVAAFRVHDTKFPSARLGCSARPAKVTEARDAFRCVCAFRPVNWAGAPPNEGRRATEGRDRESRRRILRSKKRNAGSDEKNSQQRTLKTAKAAFLESPSPPFR